LNSCLPAFADIVAVSGESLHYWIIFVHLHLAFSENFNKNEMPGNDIEVETVDETLQLPYQKLEVGKAR